MSHRILFLCVANSARSQMAEGLARRLVHGEVEVQSAGSRPTELHPLATMVLAEKGIDIAQHASKGIDEVPLDQVNTVITLCEEEVCPVLPEGATHLHWPMPDPAGPQADASGAHDAFRAVRDQIFGRLQTWLADRGLAATA